MFCSVAGCCFSASAPVSGIIETHFSKRNCGTGRKRACDCVCVCVGGPGGHAFVCVNPRGCMRPQKPTRICQLYLYLTRTGVWIRRHPAGCPKPFQSSHLILEAGTRMGRSPTGLRSRMRPRPRSLPLPPGLGSRILRDAAGLGSRVRGCPPPASAAFPDPGAGLGPREPRTRVGPTSFE